MLVFQKQSPIHISGTKMWSCTMKTFIMCTFIGVEIKVKAFQVNENAVKMQLWLVIIYQLGLEDYIDYGINRDYF